MTETPKPAPDVRLWACNEEDQLEEEADTAIELYCDQLDPVPPTVRVLCHRRMVPTVADLRGHDFVADALEHLDETYGDPEGSTSGGGTPAMRAAEAAFIAVVLAEYVPWACERWPEGDFTARTWMEGDELHWEPLPGTEGPREGEAP